nr:polysaccharide deacetylase family protein [Arthrobacter echini]
MSALIAGGLGFGVAACTQPTTPSAGPTGSGARPFAPSPSSPIPSPTAPTGVAGTPPAVTRVPLPPGVITGLPSPGPMLAWTVDDGSDSDVIRRYVDFARTSGTRLTFFLNGSYPGWSEHAALLQPLVTSGQIQLGNHTWSHADLTSLSDTGIVSELQRNHDFIVSTFGVDPRPYYRPPFGYRDARTDAAAASIGYTSPVMWYGSLADSSPRSEQQIIDLATEWFLPAHIIIGHLNFPAVTQVFGQLRQLITDRGLITVTLDDIFAR